MNEVKKWSAHALFVRLVLIRTFVGAAASICLAGCAEPKPPSTRSAKEYDSNRVDWPKRAIATPSSILLVSSVSANLSATDYQPDLILGRGARGETDEFASTSGVAVDDAGRIFVLDAVAHRVAVYAGDGTFIRYIGRKGGGPGELKVPHGEPELRPGNGIAISHDTLFILDERLQIFATDGSFLGATPPEMPFFNVTNITASKEGLIVQRQPFVSRNEMRFEFTTLDAQKGVEKQKFLVTEHYADLRDNTHRPPVPLPLLVFSTSPNGGVYFTVGDSFHIRRMRLSGDIETELISQVPRIKITDRDVDDFIQTVVKSFRSRHDMAAPEWKSWLISYPKKIERRPRAEYREAIGMIIVSNTGNILLRRTDIAERPYDWHGTSTVVEWTMLSAKGDPLLLTRLPSGFIPRVFQNCVLYGTSDDDDGTPIVLRYRIGSDTDMRCRNE